MPDDNLITGPLGVWTFPILNTLVTMSSNQSSNSDSNGSQGKVETAKVIRDSNGEVQEVIVIKE